jgi:hypothetical protein
MTLVVNELDFSGASVDSPQLCPADRSEINLGVGQEPLGYLKAESS